MKRFKNHNEFQNYIIETYRINVEEHSKCYSRTHIHPKQRKLCKWKRANSVLSTFTLLHEVGHCENNNSSMRRCEQEFYATEWALEICKEFNIKVPQKLIDKYQRYVYMELDRGLRRGGYGYPSREEMRLGERTQLL